MLKAEFIQGLGKKNISNNAELTMERIRATWQKLDNAKRNEIFALGDMKKVSVERAYKTGGVSAKVIIAIAQVLDIDPLYLIGESDEKGTFDTSNIVKRLADWGYEVGKGDIIRVKKAKSQTEESPVAESKTVKNLSDNTVSEDNAEVVNNAKPKSDAIPTQTSALHSAMPQTDLSMMSIELPKLLSDNARHKLDDLTEDDVILLIKSLNVQANFSEDKKNRLALVKCMLLL